MRTDNKKREVNFLSFFFFIANKRFLEFKGYHQGYEKE
ncbi:hypothetical protein RU85_GL000443 [Lactococcus garvieae]|nr:hypothetical protein RU85_GL000443 [Lactococcus garvieae]